MKYFKKKCNSENPYISGEIGRREWNDRYHNLTTARRNWQWAFWVCLLLVITQAIFMGRMALRSSIQPFIVETSQGMPYSIRATHPISAHDPQVVNFALNQFIINARSLIHDTAAEKNILNKVYAYSAGKTKAFLHEYYAANDPFKSANQFSVNVQIVNSMPISKNTWQITWDESKTDLINGKLIEKNRWMAQLHFEFGSVNSHFLTDNPFGIYVTDLTWSQSQTHE